MQHYLKHKLKHKQINKWTFCFGLFTRPYSAGKQISCSCKRILRLHYVMRKAFHEAFAFTCHTWRNKYGIERSIRCGAWSFASDCFPVVCRIWECILNKFVVISRLCCCLRQNWQPYENFATKQIKLAIDGKCTTNQCEHSKVLCKEDLDVCLSVDSVVCRSCSYIIQED